MLSPVAFLRRGDSFHDIAQACCLKDVSPLPDLPRGRVFECFQSLIESCLGWLKDIESA